MALTLLVACTPLTPREAIFEDAARQQQLRSIQTHSFAAEDRIKTLRAVIVTLQDLDFDRDRGLYSIPSRLGEEGIRCASSSQD